MQRLRQIAAAPERSASQTWATVSQLVIDTLDRSAAIASQDVAAAMSAAAAVGTMLVAGGHLDHHPVVVVADPVHLSITTVSGAGATTVDENLEPVPGGASAAAWTVYLPTPDPLGDAVRAVTAANVHLSAEEPPAPVEAKRSTGTAGVLNVDALIRREADR